MLNNSQWLPLLLFSLYLNNFDFAHKQFHRCSHSKFVTYGYLALCQCVCFQSSSQCISFTASQLQLHHVNVDLRLDSTCAIPTISSFKPDCLHYILVTYGYLALFQCGFVQSSSQCTSFTASQIHSFSFTASVNHKRVDTQIREAR